MTGKLLEGRNIVLRPIQIADADGPYVDWLNDEEINQYLEARFVTWTPELLRAYISEFELPSDKFLFAICTKEQHVHVGNIKLGPINPYHKFAEIGVIIGDKRYWGLGLASAAISEICRFGFGELGLNKLTAGCYEANIGSIKSFERVGFEIEGKLRKNFLTGSGFQDHILMGLLGRDFKY